jgi:hypothetical protein
MASVATAPPATPPIQVPAAKRPPSQYQQFVSSEIKKAVSTGGKRDREGMKQLLRDTAGKWKAQKSQAPKSK